MICALAAALSTNAFGASNLTIRGAGYGHGIGMSQYGAYGMAKQGFNHQQILAHYFTGTSLGSVGSQTVRVLLQPSVAVAKFSGGNRVGDHQLDGSRTYTVRRGGLGGVEVVSDGGHLVASAISGVLRIEGGAAIKLFGRADNGVIDGIYRDALEFRPSGLTGLMVVNAVDLEDYVAGVISREVMSSWPMETVKAQAIAARGYAVTTTKGKAGFDQYADTRSQVYGGVSAETPATLKAARETNGQVVTYHGKPVTTFFFSTSGGRTEDVEKAWPGSQPKPWLRSVDDPYDTGAPRHRWGPIRMDFSSASKRLGGLVKGQFRGIQVLNRGRSPRIISAEIIGTRGRTRVSGSDLRSRFGLFDTWAYFTSISASKGKPVPGGATEAPPATSPPSTDGGGAGAPLGGLMASPLSIARTSSIARLLTVARASKKRTSLASIIGTVMPAKTGATVTVERRVGASWKTISSTKVRANGRYVAGVELAGSYRVRYRGEVGPVVRVRA